jgi:hypothetical protein
MLPIYLILSPVLALAAFIAVYERVRFLKRQKCGRVQDLILASFDGELSEPEKRKMRAHIEKCAVCTDFENWGVLSKVLPFEPVPANRGCETV